MAHTETNTNLSPEETKFNEYITRGEDFCKIEIYRNAKEWFQKALEMNINNILVKEKIDICDKKIKKEKKIIYTIVAAAILIIAIVIGLKVN
ncbi:MAG: hypothetical protein PHD97_09890 [Bacteroidales bacterium]|nr:hypothetical protein [Bacteroidales bacterium]